MASGRSQPPANVARYLLKHEVATTVGVALRANQGSIATQQLICNRGAAVQSYAQVYFPGLGSHVQQQPEQRQQGVVRRFVGTEAGDGVGEGSSSDSDANDVRNVAALAGSCLGATVGLHMARRQVAAKGAGCHS